MIRALLLVLIIAAATTSVRAESLIVTLSDETVDITSNFTGSAITVFGAVRRDAATVPRASDYDVVVTVTGPRATRIARQKERVFGLWINRHAQRFDQVPSAYTALSNRPLEDIAHPALLTRLQIGTAYILADPPSAEDGPTVQAGSEPPQNGRPPEHVFERAFLRLQSEAEVYQEDAQGVEIIDNALFRARATFPADVPLGTFQVRVFLFNGGVLLAEETVEILVRKTGFEQIVFDLSQREQLLYGVLAVLLALFTGWLGGVVFRRS